MNSGWVYLLESVPWALGGFLVGYLTGAHVRRTHARQDNTEDSVSRRKWLSSQQILGLVVVLLAVATVVQGVLTTRATEQLAECQQRYSSEFAETINARAQSTSEAQDALDRLMTLVGEAVREPGTDTGAVQRAIDDYLASRREAEANRQRNPYPPPPNSICG